MSGALLCTDEGIRRVQAALRTRGLGGWLLYEFHGNNPIAAGLLGLEITRRRGYALVPAEGEPVALVHAVEASSWRGWPWRRIVYSGWRDMEARLGEMLDGAGRLAMETSPRAAVPTVDFVSAGTLELIRGLGVEPVSSADLVSEFHSAWTDAQRDDHHRAAEIVARVARDAFERAAEAVRKGEPTNEGALSAWIDDALRAEGLVQEVGCIVAIGPRAADPHYAPDGAGETLAKGNLVLIDLWGGFEGSVPADQTWMGILADGVDAKTQAVWEAVRDARDAALSFLKERAAAGETVRACEVDDVARSLITERGYGEGFVHRLGHSIDTSLHGSGPNLDNLETRDDRVLLPGVGFSVEPGIYIADHIGMRTEVNVHWTADGPEVTPAEIQREIFVLLDG